MVKGILCILLIISFPFTGWAQDSIPSKLPVKSKKEAVMKLSKSLEQSKSEEDIANDYMKLANELLMQNDYARAETYFLQAANNFGKTKNKEQQSVAYRELAKSQEMQLKFEEAIKNYNRASSSSRLKDIIELNKNDANRLKNRDNLRSQSSLIERNIELSNSTQNKNDAVQAHQQLARVKYETEGSKAAIDELQNALEIVKDKPEESIKVKEEIAKVYMADEQYDKALAINQSLVEEAKSVNNPTIEIGQLTNLSNTYFEAKETEKGISSLKEAYEIAIENGRTLEAKNILEQLTSYYQKNRNTKDALQLYADFINRLDTLVKEDSTLIDDKFFQLHEDKIAQLEKERELKDELIARQNRNNYLLTGFLILSLIFVLFIVKALYSINKKNKRIALQALRREMNPHFIFNSLNSVNQFIAQNNELEANKFLTSYSRLMRNIMENSNKDFITLSTEIEQLKEYLKLEHQRFNDKFVYEINISDSIDIDNIYIPNMLIQPQLENAIWHGLRYKEEKGWLKLFITGNGRIIEITIEDNGIGLQKSKELKTKHQRQHNSRGLSNTQERIQLLNKLYHLNISIHITEKTGDNTGVIVTLTFPIIDNKLLKDEHITENKKRNS